MRATRTIVLGAVLAFMTWLVAPANTLPMTEAFAVLDIVHVKVPYHEDLDINLAGEANYAVAFWPAEHGHAAGSALLEKNAGKWSWIKLVSPGFKDAAALESLGVPAATAKALIGDMQDR